MITNAEMATALTVMLNLSPLNPDNKIDAANAHYLGKTDSFSKAILGCVRGIKTLSDDNPLEYVICLREVIPFIVAYFKDDKGMTQVLTEACGVIDSILIVDPTPEMINSIMNVFFKVGMVLGELLKKLQDEGVESDLTTPNTVH